MPGKPFPGGNVVNRDSAAVAIPKIDGKIGAPIFLQLNG